MNNSLLSSTASSMMFSVGPVLPTTPKHSIKSYLDTWNYKFRIYSLFVIIAIGTIGNMLSFLVFIKSKLRLKSHGIYLIALAWVDTLILFEEVILRTNQLSQSHLSCKLLLYIRNVSKMLEAYLVVSVCIDRSVCLRFPFRSHKCANFRVAVISILVQYLVACALCGYTFGQIVRYGTRCNHRPDDHYRIYLYTDFTIATIVGEFLTGLVVIALAVYISIALSSLRQRARRLSCNRNPSNIVDREVTRMTIALAVTFSLFRLPYSVTYMLYFIRHTVLHYPYNSIPQLRLSQAVDVFAAISQMNYCINFVIYLIFWKAFREKLNNILGCRTSNNGVVRQSSSRRLTESTGFYNN